MSHDDLLAAVAQVIWKREREHGYASCPEQFTAMAAVWPLWATEIREVAARILAMCERKPTPLPDGWSIATHGPYEDGDGSRHFTLKYEGGEVLRLHSSDAGVEVAQALRAFADHIETHAGQPERPQAEETTNG